MSNKPNHAASLRAECSSALTQVLYLCGITRQQYADFVTETLAAWLEHFKPTLTSEEWMESEALLNWWAYQWSIADMQLLHELYRAPQPSRYHLYRMLHQDAFSTNTRMGHKLQADWRNLEASFTQSLPAALYEKTRI